jgi:hypothetical protein
VVVRRPIKGICACTNHFCTNELATSTRGPDYKSSCDRYDILEKSQEIPKLGLAQVKKNLHLANKGDHTIQTIIFEPAALNLHLAIGSCPSSKLPLKRLDLGLLLKKKK